MRIIQFTDTHLVGPGQLLHGLDPRARLDAGIAHALERFRGADLWAFTGDLTNAGTPDSYGNLAKALAPINDPVQLLLGNHDDRGNFCASFPDTELDENGFVQSYRDCEAGRLIFLDTHIPGETGGALCERRAAWLSDTLDSAGARDIYIFMHHPPFDIGIPRMDQIRLADGDPFYGLIAGRESIRHIFFGHVHRPVSGQWRGISYSSLKGTNHQVLLDFETPKLRYSEEPPTYAVIDLEPGHMRVHLMDYDTF